jgi:hypothetical protein
VRRRTIGRLHELRALTALVALALVAGCVESCGLATRAKDSGASIIETDCTWPSCVTDLLATCVPSGKCTAQVDRVTGDSTWCYANGVKVRSTVTGTSLEVCENGNAVSYSIEEHLQFVRGVPEVAFTIKDGLGTTAATGASDSAGITVACDTGPTFVLPASCGLPSPRGVNATDGGMVTNTCDESSACVP